MMVFVYCHSATKQSKKQEKKTRMQYRKDVDVRGATNFIYSHHHNYIFSRKNISIDAFSINRHHIRLSFIVWTFGRNRFFFLVCVFISPREFYAFFLSLQCIVRTCLISFSISPARITNGPRTAYSILMTFGFIESNVSVFVDDAMVRLVCNCVFSYGDVDNNCVDARSTFAVKALNWRLFARRRQFVRPLLVNTVFKHRLLIIVCLVFFVCCCCSVCDISRLYISHSIPLCIYTVWLLFWFHSFFLSLSLSLFASLLLCFVSLACSNTHRLAPCFVWNLSL